MRCNLLCIFYLDLADDIYQSLFRVAVLYSAQIKNGRPCFTFSIKVSESSMMYEVRGLRIASWVTVGRRGDDVLTFLYITFRQM